MNNNVIIIFGPTAVGKSAVAVELAKMINGEIISADSMQIYKNLNIGTAKITEKEMQGIPHYLIDEKNPSEDYSVAEFVKSARTIITKIQQNGKTPIIVGGTGLYIKSLISGYNFAQTTKNEKLRIELNNMSNEQLANYLLQLNPEKKFDKQNRQRLIRYIEIELNDGQYLKTADNNNYHLFCIIDDREKIYERINKRVDEMVDDGILNELNYLMNLNLSNNCLAMKAIGYKELIPYYNKTDSLENCLNILKQKTRNYAKRQITFLNQFNNKNIIKLTTIKETATQIKEKYEKELLNGTN